MGRLIIGVNDLATVNPDLAAEWHPTKNGKLTPEQITAGSNKKVWWLGECGHEWQAAVSDRVRGRGCPLCQKERKTSFPEQVLFFYLSQVTETVNRFQLSGKTEIDVYLPEQKVGVEYDGQTWHKNVQKDLEKNRICKQFGVRLIRIREPQCPLLPGECIVLNSLSLEDLNCAVQELCTLLGKRIDVNVERDRQKIYEQYIESNKINSLKVVRPDIAAEWHPTKNGRLTPEQVMVSSHKKVWWLGKCGHEWQMKISNRTSNLKQNCPICANQQLLPGFNDLATINQGIAKEWHPTKNGELTPQMVMPGSNRKVWWLGKCGHEWESSISKRTEGRDCPYCNSRKVLTGFNDLETTYPDIAAEWHPTKNGNLLPSQIMVRSNKKVWWKCAKGHEWQATVDKRTSGQGCPVCSHRQLLVGYNDLATTNPKLAAEWHPSKNGGLTPANVMAGSGRKVWWLCQVCGHEWNTTPNSRTTNKRGCPKCWRQKKRKTHKHDNKKAVEE